MAKQIITTLIDDLDGSEADESIRFGLDGKDYEIDLSEKNAKELRELLDIYRDKARAVPRAAHNQIIGSRRTLTPRPTVDRDQNRAIREWAGRNGFDISDRGRIPQEIVDAFHAQKPNPAKAAPAKPVKSVKAADKAAPAALFQSSGKDAKASAK
jgi:hypothetical protein